MSSRRKAEDGPIARKRLTADAPAGALLRFWPEGRLFWWHRDGTVEQVEDESERLSDWEVECAHLRYVEELSPPAISRRTGRPRSAVNSALNRARAKAGLQWHTYQEVRERFTGRSLQI